MNHVKAGEVVRQGVGLVKFKRVMALRCDVHPDNLKACAVVPRGRATCAAE